MSFDPPISLRVEHLLNGHPSGMLHVATGRTSFWGLAWLHRRTTDRPVTLLVGDLSRKHFIDRKGQPKGTKANMNATAEFCDREDVKILTWSRITAAPEHGKQPPFAHSKVWAVEGDTGSTRYAAVLAGSANLTWFGLGEGGNVETMVEPSPADQTAIFNQISELENASEDATKIVKALVEEALNEVSPKPAQGLGERALEVVEGLFPFGPPNKDRGNIG